MHHSGVKNHSPVSDIWKIMLHLKVIERRLFRDNLFDEFPNPRGVSLAGEKNNRSHDATAYGLLHEFQPISLLEPAVQHADIELTGKDCIQSGPVI